MNRMYPYYILVVTQIFSLIGSRMTGVAVGIWLFAETGDASPLLIAAFFAELPHMAGGIFAGWMADRYSRKMLLILGDAGQAAGTLLLIVSISMGIFELWHLYTVMLFQGIFATVQQPAATASIAMLVPEKHRDRANGIREIGFPLAGIVAPALAGLIYSVAALRGVIIVDLFTFMGAVLVIALLRIPNPEQSEEGRAASTSMRSELLGGLTFLRSRPALFGTVIYISFFFFLINGPLELAIPYLSTLSDNESTIGILLSMMSFGAFAGGMIVAVIGNAQNRMKWILCGYMFHGIMLVLYGMTRDVWLMGLTIFLLMIPLPLGGALFNSILQTKTPTDMQGRVFAITDQFFTLTTPFSFLITAYLVDEHLEPAVGSAPWNIFAPLVGTAPGAGMGLLLVTIGVIIIITTGVVLAIPAVRHLETRLPAYKAFVAK